MNRCAMCKENGGENCSSVIALPDGEGIMDFYICGFWCEMCDTVMPK